MFLRDFCFAISLVVGCKALESFLNRNRKKVYRPIYTILGDIGGTNIRLQLVLIQPPHDQPLEIVKKQKYRVKDYEKLIDAFETFLADVPREKYPEVGSIGIAGAIKDNKTSLANVKKWGTIDGNELKNKLKMRDFVIINDFSANSYGLLVMKEDNFVSLNGFDINPSETRGVFGPGTGLGNSIIFSAPFRKRQRVYVLPSEGGHVDCSYVDEQGIQYLKFFKENADLFYISLQRSFCGPAIPYMFQFFSSKNPHLDDSHLRPTSQQIIKKFMVDPEKDSLYKMTIEFFIKLYSNAIANFLSTHMCTGGIYLVGGLTNSIIGVLKGRDFLKGYKERHPEMYENIKDIPIVVSKEVDLGLRGAFVYARRIIADEQHE